MVMLHFSVPNSNLSPKHACYVTPESPRHHFNFTMPRGRPRAPTFIVEQQRTAADLLALNINHRKVVGIASTPRECLSFLAEYHLIANTMVCAVCHEPARLTALPRKCRWTTMEVQWLQLCEVRAARKLIFE